VLTLALGIGANTALFSICNAVLLKPLPYSDPDRIVMLWEELPNNKELMPVAPANFTDWREQTTAFSEIAAINPFPNFIVTGNGEPLRLAGAAVSWNFFSLLGTQITMGRSFLREEDQPERNRVAILSYRTWVNRFGARPDILGKNLAFNEINYTVIGILPQDFEFVSRASDFQARNQFDVWIPLGLNSANLSRGTHPLRVFARIKPRRTLDEAKADLNVVASNLARAFPEDDKDRGIRAVPLRQQVTAELRPALLTLLGAVGFVLLIACANVANLLLSRGAARMREISVRLAMGASRGQVAQQLFVESTVLALAGGTVGVVLALTTIHVVQPYLPADLSRAGVVLDARVLTFSASISLATGILFGLAPLFQMRRVNANESLKQGMRIAGGPHTRLGSGLVVGHVAVTMILLISAGLMAKSFWILIHVPAGFRTDHLLTARITLPRLRYPDAGRIAAFQQEFLEQLHSVPGIQSAGLAAYLPLSGDDNGWAFFIEGRPPLPTGVYDVAKYRPVSHGYFQTIQIPLIRGRDFSRGDSPDAPPVVVINESMARTYWGQQNPVGQRLRFGSPVWRTVIGVVGGVRHEGLDHDLKPEMFVPFAQAPQPETVSTIVVRTAVDPAAMTTTLRKILSAIDAALPLDQVRTMEQLVSSSVGQPRFQTFLLAVFAMLALAMASVGIYGVTNYSVMQRTREFGIYIAVGATARDVLRLVLGRALVLIASGLGLGLLASLALARFIATFLYGVAVLDPSTFVTIPLFLCGVALVASYLPARRATKVDPMLALRDE